MKETVTMGPLGNTVEWLSAGIEAILWLTIWLGILTGWLLRGGARLIARWTAWRRSRRTKGADASRVATQVASLLLATMFATPSVAGAQGWWPRAPSNPGFDQNTVIQVAGTAAQVRIVPRGGPSTLRLDTGRESYTVMLGPGWYLAELHIDIRDGDAMVVEGSKLMDRRGNLHLVAARITNRRTGSVLELRDEMGRPRWMLGRPTGNAR